MEVQRSIVTTPEMDGEVRSSEGNEKTVVALDALETNTNRGKAREGKSKGV